MFKKVLKWVGIAILAAYVALVIYRAFVLQAEENTQKQVEKIHTTKLSLDDVLGKNLPPDPGAEADTTVQGVDANANGIRDDVELAIFAEYPNSAKTRAVLLQYALALQMEVTQEMVNTGTVVAAVQEEDRAFVCIGEVVPRDEDFDEETDTLTDFVKNKQLNTSERKQARTEFYDKIDSYSSLDQTCDIELSTLPN